MLAEQLDGNHASELRVFCLVHNSHAPTAELFQDAIVRDCFPDHGSPRDTGDGLHGILPHLRRQLALIEQPHRVTEALGEDMWRDKWYAGFDGMIVEGIAANMKIVVEWRALRKAMLEAWPGTLLLNHIKSVPLKPQ